MEFASPSRSPLRRSPGISPAHKKHVTSTSPKCPSRVFTIVDEVRKMSGGAMYTPKTDFKVDLIETRTIFI
jgi:hypothetical protein